MDSLGTGSLAQTQSLSLAGEESGEGRGLRGSRDMRRGLCEVRRGSQEMRWGVESKDTAPLRFLSDRGVWKGPSPLSPGQDWVG